MADEYLSPDIIRNRLDQSKQRARFFLDSDTGAGQYSPLTGLLQGLGGGLAWQDQAGQEGALKTNQRMTSDTLKRASSSPNAATLSRVLIDSGIPDLGNQGLGILASSQEKAADRAAQLEQQKELFRFQKQEATDAALRERKMMMESLREAGLLPAQGAVVPTAPTTPAATAGPVNSNAAFADDLLIDDGHKAPSSAQKAGIAMALGEKGKAVDALMEKGAKLTESQTKDAGFAERMLRAEAGMREVVPIDKEGNFLKYDPTSGINRFLPDWNITNSKEWQSYQRNAREGVAAILRKDTGAAVSDTEWDWYFPMYYPQPGDSAQVVADKQRARIAVARGLRAASGPAFDQMFPRFNEQLRARLEAAGADLTPKPAGQATGGAATPASKYAQIKRNPKTGATVGFNAQTGQWEPIGQAPAEPVPALGEMATP